MQFLRYAMNGIKLSGKVLRNSAQRSTCSEQRDHLTRHVVTYKKFENVRPKVVGVKSLTRSGHLRAVLIIVKGFNPGVTS